MPDGIDRRLLATFTPAATDGCYTASFNLPANLEEDGDYRVQLIRSRLGSFLFADDYSESNEFRIVNPDNLGFGGRLKSTIFGRKEHTITNGGASTEIYPAEDEVY